MKLERLSNSALLSWDNLAKLVVIFGIFGAVQMLLAGIWDASSHALKAPEFFWSIQHVAVYAGVSMVACSAIAGFLVLQKNRARGLLRKGILLIIIGAALQIAFGYADSVSHEVFGIDGLVSWSHQPLELGLVIGALGAFFVLKSYPDSKIQALMPVSIMTVILSAMWLLFSLSLLAGAHLMCLPVYEVFSSGCAIL